MLRPRLELPSAGLAAIVAPMGIRRWWEEENGKLGFHSEVRGWIDGRLADERTDWRWRDVDTLHVEQVWMNFYHGGTAVPPADLHAYIDNVIIATEYIGPMGAR